MARQDVMRDAKTIARDWARDAKTDPMKWAVPGPPPPTGPFGVSKAACMETYAKQAVDLIEHLCALLASDVQEGWWHPNVKSGQVHDHPEKPGRGWSEASHRLCEPVYTRRDV